jgi:hypothetical protein
VYQLFREFCPQKGRELGGTIYLNWLTPVVVFYTLVSTDPSQGIYRGIEAIVLFCNSLLVEIS